MSLCSDVDFVFYIYYHFFFHWTETAPVQEVPPPRPPLPTEATAPPPRPPLPSNEMVEVQQVLEQPPEDNRMAVCLLLTSCNDHCSQFSTLALPKINLFTPPPPPSLPKCCCQCLLGPVARSLVSATRWLRGIKMYRSLVFNAG